MSAGGYAGVDRRRTCAKKHPACKQHFTAVLNFGEGLFVFVFFEIGLST
jgi:hypothetical protein